LFIQSKIIVLKISENKEEIRYILKFYYKKGKNATQAAKKFMMFMDMMQYQYVGHKADSSVFNLEILSKMHFGQPITGKVDEIMEKVEQD